MRRKKKPLTKSQAQVAHAKRRALERYDLHLTTADYRDMCRVILSGRAQDIEFIVRRSCRLSLHRIRWKGQSFIVGYDSARKNITTFLTPVQAENNVRRTLELRAAGGQAAALESQEDEGDEFSKDDEAINKIVRHAFA